jgi:hypothetical protein
LQMILFAFCEMARLPRFEMILVLAASVDLLYGMHKRFLRLNRIRNTIRKSSESFISKQEMTRGWVHVQCHTAPASD